jgi:hypothetical protein
MALIALRFNSGIFQRIMTGQDLFLKTKGTHAPLDLYWDKTDKSDNYCRNLHVCGGGGVVEGICKECMYMCSENVRKFYSVIQ